MDALSASQVFLAPVFFFVFSFFFEPKGEVGNLLLLLGGLLLGGLLLWGCLLGGWCLLLWRGLLGGWLPLWGCLLGGCLLLWRGLLGWCTLSWSGLLGWGGTCRGGLLLLDDLERVTVLGELAGGDGLLDEDGRRRKRGRKEKKSVCVRYAGDDLELGGTVVMLVMLVFRTLRAIAECSGVCGSACTCLCTPRTWRKVKIKPLLKNTTRFPVSQKRGSIVKAPT